MYYYLFQWFAYLNARIWSIVEPPIKENIIQQQLSLAFIKNINKRIIVKSHEAGGGSW